VGGYVFGALGRLPVVGDRLQVENVTFTVQEMDGRKIDALGVDFGGATPADAAALSDRTAG
jgi:CBS domain containing-hemolysin-like protein